MGHIICRFNLMPGQRYSVKRWVKTSSIVTPSDSSAVLLDISYFSSTLSLATYLLNLILSALRVERRESVSRIVDSKFEISFPSSF